MPQGASEDAMTSFETAARQWRRCRRRCAVIAAALAMTLSFLAASPATAEVESESLWHRYGADGLVEINLYVFWSLGCPHCHKAMTFLEGYEAEAPWLRVQALEISRNQENAGIYQSFAQALGTEARYVPAFFYCGTGFSGFDAAETTGAFLKTQLENCREILAQGAAVPAGPPSDTDRAGGSVAPAPPGISLPLIGELDAMAMSLPITTLVLAGLDSFNPCAFFVLLFLLSLMVHARSRARMLIVGGVFVLISGLVYFVFMAAWLNLFQLVGHLQAVTLVAGGVAAAVGLLNIKDYFLPWQGPTLAIPEGAKPRLFERMRGLVAATSLSGLLLGTVTLAIAANAYELLCTAGFPMVFTRILTLNELPTTVHYLYLALYNAVYVLPLLIIVVVFAVALGARKLKEEEGRILKLVSGLMMLGLGLILLVAPELLNNVLTAAGLLAAAGLVSLVIVRLRRLFTVQV
jgi:thiol-disulfide isomerase/thioredoxin